MKNIIYILYSFLLFLMCCNSETKIVEQHNDQNILDSLNKVKKLDSLNLATQMSIEDYLENIPQKNSQNESELEELELGDTSFQIPNSKRFDVDNVHIARKFLLTNKGKDIFENKLNRKILFMPKEHKNAQLVNSYNNVLLQTIHKSFDEHRPLVLSPDIIWLAITQGASIHINEKFDSLEKVIFKKNKPKKLVIRNDSLEYDGRHWQDLVSSLSNETTKYTNSDFYSFFVPKFSTTTKTQTTAYQVTLLNSYKKAFEYVGESGCGIPYITITGKKEDWELIYSRLKELDKLGLKYWRIELEPIIQEFINVFDDKTNIIFWKDIYKNMEGYGADYSSGWIIKFFPYILSLGETVSTDEETYIRKIEKIFIKNKFLEGNNYLLSTLSTDVFPSSIVEIDITWNNHFKNETQKLKLYAGFFAIKQYQDKSLEPVISWALCEKKARFSDHELKYSYRDEKMVHYPNWSPFIVDSMTNSAIYNHRRFKNSIESIEFVKQKIKSDLEARFSKTNVSKDTVSFVVLLNGKVENIKFTGTKEAKNQIEETLKNLDEEWFPAIVKAGRMARTSEQRNLRVKANSKVIIPLN
ncbi:DUF4419 domain-containing protein [Bernardetia sp. Wsw4-3y2]|uniref:DUF4419 domain-containing protein n=1 Tax=Bernardetia sp. Wsw4-3y2 TaxID=3127471 RepID=UPI0030D5C910